MIHSWKKGFTPIWQLEYYLISFSWRTHSILNTFNPRPYLTIRIFENCLNWTHPYLAILNTFNTHPYLSFRILWNIIQLTFNTHPYLTMEFDQRIVLHPRAPSRHSTAKTLSKICLKDVFCKSGNWILNTGDLKKDANLILRMHTFPYV